MMCERCGLSQAEFGCWPEYFYPRSGDTVVVTWRCMNKEVLKSARFAEALADLVKMKERLIRQQEGL